MVAAGEAGGILDTILHPSRHVPGKERRPGPQGEGRHDLPGRHHQRGRRSRSRCCSSSSSRRSRACSRRSTSSCRCRRASSSGCRNFLIHYWWAMIGADRRRRLRASGSTTRTPAGKLADRPAAAQGAGARRRAPQVGGVALHPDAGHADQLRRVDSRRPRDHGQDRRQPGHPRRDHGVARSRSPAVKRSPRRSRSRRSSRRWSSR